MKLVLKKIFIGFISIFFLFSCNKEKREGQIIQCYAEPLTYDEQCTPTEGCILSFSCPSLTQQESASTKFTKFSEKLGFTSHKTSNLQVGPSLDVFMTGVTTLIPALLQTAPGPVPTIWYSSTGVGTTLTCTTNSSGYVCPGFAPLSTQFTLYGTITTAGFQNQKISIHTKINPSSTFVATANNLVGGCGQIGTVFQRMFDCSQRVKNYSGIVNPDSYLEYNYRGQANPKWFLVACPAYENGVTVQQCSWLTPSILPGTPSDTLYINPNTGAEDPTTPILVPNDNDLTNARILWSGLINNGAPYSFYQANSTTNTGIADCDGSGSCALYTPYPYNFSFAQFMDLISSVNSTPNLPNICYNQFLRSDKAFSKMLAPSSWIIPSYPMLMTLTGSCNGKSNTSCNPLGFSAQNSPVPNFVNPPNLNLVSSSLNSSNQIWAYSDSSGMVTGDINDPYAVRCATVLWDDPISIRSDCNVETILPYNNSNCSADGCKLSFNCINVFGSNKTTEMNILDITINQPSLLQASAGSAPAKWSYPNKLSCVINRTSVICDNFLPIASDFTLQGFIMGIPLKLNVTVNNELTPSTTNQCGQAGTTVQRMFDCSMRVENYAGFGTGANDNGFTPFVPGGSGPSGDPDTNWFLVSCPDTNNKNCFWLSPVLQADNPAIGPGQYDSFHDPMIYNLNNRLLWSGESSPSYNFFVANGKNPFNVSSISNAYYELYLYEGNQSATQTYTGPIYNPTSSLTPKMLANSNWASTSNLKSACETPGGPPVLPSLVGGTQYNWQMPSYPMILTLTGAGTGRICEQGGGGGYPANAFCNKVGFRAISSLPGFSTDIQLRSSSLSGDNSVQNENWVFDGLGLVLDMNEVNTFNSIRCASTNW